MKLNTTIFICQLPQDIQDYIQGYVWEYLFNEGYNAIEIKETLENVMCDRIVNVEHVLDMDELEKMINKTFN
jgi:hypothetical protein